MLTRRSFILGLGALALATLISGCGDKQNRTYRIGLGPWIGFGPLYLAKEKGYFKDAGLDVELIVLTGLAERNSALKAGKIDALAAPVDYFVLAAGNNLVATIVMAVDESAGGDGIVARNDIQTVADLRGKKVAFQRGLPSGCFSSEPCCSMPGCRLTTFRRSTWRRRRPAPRSSRAKSTRPLSGNPG